ncbi:hypothetical protein K493DRAFT_108081 [Basidiobolus meristosporus CBS 931.73]|uniref:Transcription initiation factor TFIID subunit 8 n=1 Tax=Basidiobolus meristosporus CBS 931.73 TaxID=1314790 RepID=A0A1Y1YP52_9FUNG|nr:hypothetical protein K493DRAFT_108081 [Basidiobolus meristosporus CBS 931.73]|eukprot:ORX99782.1 hypothetical protein K493DRAFT_108081 [Basidiobolus meristosporus CBS 931.73]
MTSTLYLEYTKKIIALICKEIGFDGISASALDALLDATPIYIEEILATAHSYAELSSRTRPNVNDLAFTFADMGIDLNKLESFMYSFKHITFPALNEYNESHKNTIDPAFMEGKHNPLTDDEESEPFPEYIPNHMPPFPSTHTFKQTPVFPQRPEDPNKLRELNTEQTRLVEGNLKRLLMSSNNTDNVNQNGMLGSLSTELFPIVNYELAKLRQLRKKGPKPKRPRTE